MNPALKQRPYTAIISSDWNQCLAPCGPFDPIIFTYPDLTSDLTKIFKDYTGNKISLGTANEKIARRLPEPISAKQMDDYLKASFMTYKGVPELIDWCKKNNILFMINTTGLLGYFQRIYANNLLPEVPVLSANPLIRFPHTETDPAQIYDLNEIEDKGINTARALESFALSEEKIVVIGDSGGDGPHFEWGKAHGAYLIGSMAKHSLMKYCRRKKIRLNRLFGPLHVKGEAWEDEMRFDFMDLTSVLEQIFK